MGIFKRIFGGTPTRTVFFEDLPDARTGREVFGETVVGESHYQPALKRALRTAVRDDRGRRVVPIVVRCEPTNKHDANACLVQSIHGETLGYLPRERAARYHQPISELGGIVRCSGSIVGGGQGESLGIYLDLKRAGDMLRKPKAQVVEEPLGGQVGPTLAAHDEADRGTGDAEL